MPKKKPVSAPPPSPPVVPLVAIGASAGGIEAVTALLENLSPTTGLAFVYIQHLDPNANSQLTSILGRVTSMTVREAGHLMRIQPNELYVIPPDGDIEVIDGVLSLLPRQLTAAQHMPIDRFFISLAERQKEVAIGVLLSGMASDGTLGLRAIKMAGGITFAQDETARFQSMPRSATAERVVDQVLPPADIARELERLSRKPEFFLQAEQAENREDDLDEDIQAIIRLLQKGVGVDFSNYKLTTIRRRIIRRMLLFKLEILSQYTAYLRQHPPEMEQLYSDLLIHVTTFFRDPDTMAYLSTVVFPRIIKEKAPREPIRIWIPACSTGQEAYSLAMLLIEALGDKASGTTVQIFATDLSEQAIGKARHGNYTRAELMDVSARRLQRFFTKTDDHYRINRTVRDLCVFAPHNVLKDPPFSRLDLVSCRNLLIYLGTPFQRRAIAMFHYGLNPSGYLLLGKSETVGSLTTLFSQPEKNVKVYIRKNDVVSRASFELSTRTGFERTELGDGKDRQDDGQPTPAGYLKRFNTAVAETGFIMNDLEKTVDELLLRQYVPACVIVNNDLDIIRFRGSTSLFLEPSPGKASLNLLKMARPSLVFELRNTVHKVRQSGQAVRKSGLEVNIKDKVYQVAIEVVPLNTNSEDRLYLVLFEELEPTPLLDTDLTEQRNSRIRQLEEELATLREDMRSIVEEQEASNEELQSANEEIISSNEELQSINEELETSKEEIESTNEELLTINQELQVRNDQLSEANEFSEVIFATIREATLVLDEELRVKSANKTFYRLFGVDENQTEGRLIYELGNRQWDIPELRTLLTDVIRHNSQVDAFEMTHTFSGIGERVLLINARRIVRQQDAILLAIEDITEHRRSQSLLTEREAWLHDLVENAPVLIWVCNASGAYTFFNKAWVNFTGHELDEAIRRDWLDDLHPDDRKPYEANYASALARQVPFQMELRLKRHDGEYRWMLLNASPSLLPGDSTPGESTGTPEPPGKPEGNANAAAPVFNGYIGTCAEIYNQKTLIQALDLRAQQRMQRIFESNATVAHARQELAQTTTGDTSRKQAQKTLRQREEAFRLLTEDTPDMITRWGPDLRLLYANEAFEQRAGITLTDLLGKTSEEIGQPASITLPYMNKLQLVFDTGVLQSHYNSSPTTGGLDYYYSRLVPESDDNGAIVSVLAIAQNVTDLKLVEEIQQTAFNLQGVLDSSPAAIGLLRAVRNDAYQLLDFELMVCNQKFATLVQYPMEQLPGRSVKHLTGALWQNDTFAELEKVLLSGQTTYKEQHQQHNDGNRWLGTSIARHDDGLVLTALDITALKRASQQQESWVSELSESNETIQSLEAIREQLRQRGAFLRSTSHDLRSNFGIIQGAASLLNMAETDEQRAEMLTMLQRNINQATHLLAELLDYSRLEAGQEQRQIAPFDVSELLCGLVDSIRPLAAERNLQINGQGNEPFMVDSDAVKVHRVAQNILLNALNYTQTGSVTISWGESTTPNCWQFAITDTGPGLTWPDVLTSTTVTAGEGIGLLIVQQLCELLEGKIEVTSEPGKGTRFQVTLPRGY